MQNPSNQVSYPLLRKGQQLSIVKVPDEFTVRTERGVNEVELSRSFGCAYKEGLNQQNLSILSVDTEDRDAVMDRMRSSEGVDFTSHVYALSNDPLARIYLTDELAIQFKTTITPEQIEAIINDLGINYVKEVKGLAHCYVFRLTKAARMNPLKMAAKVQGMEAVVYAEANIGIKSISYYTPSDNLFEMQWHLQHDGGIQLANGAHVDIKKAWDITLGDRSVTVAIADDSVDLDHRDFLAEGKIVAPRDFKGFDFNPAPEESTDNHGTSCAGVAVAEENGEGVVGAAPDCSLMPIRTTGFLDDNSIEALFAWATEQGAAVMSNSWGPSSVNFPLSIRQEQAISRAAREGRGGKGMLICFAAGNANRPVNGTVEEKGWPDGMLQGAVRWYNGYATHPDVMAIAACTSLNRKSAYSSWGEEISVCAPSNNVHPVFGRGYTYPLIAGGFPGRGITTTDRVGPLGYSSSDYTSNFGGTSSACPLVAGVAALVISANPGLNAKEVREILEQTADKITDTSTDPQLGVSYGTYDSNGHSRWFGYGKINAFKAVAEAVRRRGEPVEDEKELQLESSPGTLIPDNSEAGIVDKILVSKSGTLQSVQVDLKITHTYIGDLQVALGAPSGQRIFLHNRNGGSSNNLEKQYSVANMPALNSLIGKGIKGNWQLFVRDLAPQDIGRLDRWALQLGYEESGKIIELSESPGVTIPDDEPEGLIRSLSSNIDSKIQQIEVEIDISHTYISDLIVALIPPNEQPITLHNRAGENSDNIKAVFNTDNFPLLAQLIGTSAKGNWKLELRDLARQDIGKLNNWAVRMEVE